MLLQLNQQWKRQQNDAASHTGLKAEITSFVVRLPGFQHCFSCTTTVYDNMQRSKVYILFQKDNVTDRVFCQRKRVNHIVVKCNGDVRIFVTLNVLFLALWFMFMIKVPIHLAVIWHCKMTLQYMSGLNAVTWHCLCCGWRCLESILIF